MTKTNSQNTAKLKPIAKQSIGFLFRRTFDMSVIHLIIPYSKEFETDEFLRWYEQELPSDLRYGRLPSLDEFKAAVEANIADGYKLSTFSSEIMVSLSVNSMLDNGHLLYTTITGLHSGELRYSFQGDRDYLAEIIKTLPYDCGSFLLITNGENPEFVTALIMD
jgi:hypothetical protein